MNTPIYDFVKTYCASAPARFHMPGHKGRGPLGCEELDLTEIPGADSLYEARGIIAESEANASRRFGCPTFYSTEGSSHCIRAMLLLAAQLCHSGRREDSGPLADGDAGAGENGFLTVFGMTQSKGFRVLAARNVHRTFLSAAALLDLDVAWLPGTDGSYLSAHPTPETLETALAETAAGAVYLTCPDYLGFLPDLAPLAAVCHAHGALLLADNAHGAYLRFLTPSRHPMDLGADLCCDSAHKTLPVLTGGAYLHVSPALLARAGERGGVPDAPVREALGLFGSTSPSYLILQSLDLANPYLEALPEKLAAFLPRVEALKARLAAAGWTLAGDEPLKLTLRCTGWRPAAPHSAGREETGPLPPAGGVALGAALEARGIYCEFADPDYTVFLLAPSHTPGELARLEAALLALGPGPAPAEAPVPPAPVPRRVCSLREAMLAPAVWIPAGESLGRVLARPCVSCPPAVPILMPGEVIDEAARAAFARYGIETIAVLPSGRFSRDRRPLRPSPIAY